MFDKSVANASIPAFLRFVTAVECIVVFGAAVLLFFFPGQATELWAWAIPPYNSRFVGTVYFAAYVPLIIFWATARWTPGRFVLRMIFAFTTVVMVVMLIHWDKFAWDRPATYLVLWPLYLFLPANSVIHLYWLRNLKLAGVALTSTGWRYVLGAAMVVLGLYGAGLLLLPDAFIAFWPWKVDAFHARMYAAAFTTPALGCGLLLRQGAPSEFLTLGLNFLTASIFSIVGTLITSATVPPERQVNFALLDTWIYIGAFVVGGVMGIGLVIRGSQLAKK